MTPTTTPLETTKEMEVIFWRKLMTLRTMVHEVLTAARRMVHTAIKAVRIRNAPHRILGRLIRRRSLKGQSGNPNMTKSHLSPDLIASALLPGASHTTTMDRWNSILMETREKKFRLMKREISGETTTGSGHLRHQRILMIRSVTTTKTHLFQVIWLPTINFSTNTMT